MAHSLVVRLNANYHTLKKYNMICPKCNKKPISGIRFFFKISPKNILCQNCGTELKFGKMLKRGFYIMMPIAVLLGFFSSSAWSENILGFQFSITTAIVIFFVLVLLAQYLIWSFGTLEEQKHL